jgi:hypothetical protein
MKKVLILSNPRTGSTYLKDAINNSNSLFYDELIHPMPEELRKHQYKYLKQTFPELKTEQLISEIFKCESVIDKIKKVDKILNKISAKNKNKNCIGYKIFIQHLDNLNKLNPSDIFSFFDKVIFLNRSVKDQIYSKFQADKFIGYTTLNGRMKLDKMSEIKLDEEKNLNFVLSIINQNAQLSKLQNQKPSSKFISIDYKNFNNFKPLEDHLGFQIKARFKFSPIAHDYNAFFKNNPWIEELL